MENITEFAGADGFPMELPIPSITLQELAIDYATNHYWSVTLWMLLS